MVTLILGYDLMFWTAVALTIAIFADLATCWWTIGLKIHPLKKYREKLCKYHKYTKIALIITALIHITLHILFQGYGIFI